MAKDLKIPSNYQTVMPYLIINDAANFIAFTEQVFSAKQTYKTMRNEKIIAHAEIMIGECTIMLADSFDDIELQPAGLFVYVENADKIYKKAIVAGATIIRELSDQPYGRSGGVMDPFGNSWWITSLA